MLVKDFIQEFLLGDFYVMLEDDTSEFKPNLVNRALLFFNSGLSRVYTDFELTEKGLIITPIVGRTTYPLLKTHTFTSDSDDVKFIDDRGNPFLEDVGEVILVYDQFNRPYSINNTEDPYSVFTPTPNVLQIPASSVGISSFPETLPMYLIVYKAIPVKYTMEDEVPLSPMLHEALRLYMAHRLTIGESDELRKNREYYARYNEEVMRLKANGFSGKSFFSMHDNVYKFDI